MPPADPVEVSPSQDRVPIKEKSIVSPKEPAKAKKPTRKSEWKLDEWELEELLDPYTEKA
jgi:hypothetical protein